MQTKSTPTRSNHVASKPSSLRRRSLSATAPDNKLKKFISPMLAQLHDEAFNDPQWLFEIKWDGYRAVAEVNQGDVNLYSRNGLSFSDRYDRVSHALSLLPVKAVFDGEIIVLNDQSKPDFQKLQQYELHRALPVVYYVFDCISVNGKSIANLPLVERKAILRELIPADNEVIKYSDHILEEGKLLFDQVLKNDLEGIIAKRIDSSYIAGKRTSNWLKIKNHNTQEAIIAGFTEPRGSRAFFGALILAIKDKNKLRYIGHTGTGFSNATLRDLFKKMQPFIVKDSPFDKKIPVNGKVTWLSPQLVCAVKYTELTADGILRHPVYMGLRVDKEAGETDTIDKAVTKPAKERVKKLKQ